METRPFPLLAGKQILIVEDNYLAAADMQQAIEAVSGEVLGPALSLDHAKWWIEQRRPDCGILDVMIGPHTTTSIARKLNELGVPFIVTSGYSREILPPLLRLAPYIGKPFLREQLIDGVAASMGVHRY